MKIKFNTLILSLYLILSIPASASLEMLMGGGASGPAEDDMNFVTFFQKADEKTTFSDSNTFLTEDGKRSLRVTVHMARDKAKKKPESWGENVPWMTKKEQEQAASHLPGLAKTNDASSLFSAFLETLIEKTLGEDGIPAPDFRLAVGFVNTALKSISRLPDILEREEGIEKSPQKRKREAEKGVEVDGEISLKRPHLLRPRLTKTFVLDTIYEGEAKESRVQKMLFDRLMSGDFTQEGLYLAPGGFVHISLESYATPEAVLENAHLMRFAQRIPLNGVEVLGDFQTWFEATCNEAFKKLVYHKIQHGIYN